MLSIKVEFDTSDSEEQKDVDFLLEQGSGFLKKKLRESRIVHETVNKKE